MLYELHRENLSLGFLTRSEANQAVQLQKVARGLKFWVRQKRDITISEAKTKALFSCMVTVQLICTFVFVYAKSRFSNDAAYMSGLRNLI